MREQRSSVLNSIHQNTDKANSNHYTQLNYDCSDTHFRRIQHTCSAYVRRISCRIGNSMHAELGLMQRCSRRGVDRRVDSRGARSSNCLLGSRRLRATRAPRAPPRAHLCGATEQNGDDPDAEPAGRPPVPSWPSELRPKAQTAPQAVTRKLRARSGSRNPASREHFASQLLAGS